VERRKIEKTRNGMNIPCCMSGGQALIADPDQVAADRIRPYRILSLYQNLIGESMPADKTRSPTLFFRAGRARTEKSSEKAKTSPNSWFVRPSQRTMGQHLAACKEKRYTCAKEI
jgi:hypothetical protein